MSWDVEPLEHNVLTPRPFPGTQARVGCCAADAAPLLDVRDAWDALVAHRAGKPWSAALQVLPRAQRDDEVWESAGVAQTRRRRTEIALSTISERVLGRPMNKAMQCALDCVAELKHYACMKYKHAGESVPSHHRVAACQ